MRISGLTAAGLVLLASSAVAQDRIASNDHYVNVVSTAPSETGQTVRLYSRERVKGTPDAGKLKLFRWGI
jgi:hypothetical protein